MVQIAMERLMVFFLAHGKLYTSKLETHFTAKFCYRIPMALLDIDCVGSYSLKSSEEEVSDFDRLIQNSWEQKMKDGIFRYPFKHPECKKLSGNIGYLAQFNSFRVIILIS